jgi:hypothetical protein
MSDWKITGKCSNSSVIGEALTLGLYPRSYDYIVENTKTGEVKEVTAFSEKHAGEKIADGQFKNT